MYISLPIPQSLTNRFMKTIILILYFFLVSGFAKAQSLPVRDNHVDLNGKKQGDWIYYYDTDWNILKDSTGSQFYRFLHYKNSNPSGRVRDYYADGRIQMLVDSIINEDPEKYEGNLSLYSEEGNITLVEYYTNGQLDTAQSIILFEQLITKYQKEIPGHLDLAFTANNLAYLYREQQRYNMAESYYLLAKEIREKQLGTNNVLYANSCNKLAYVYFQQGIYDRAEPLYIISKRVHEMTLGKESGYYANARGNLAYIYFKTDQYHLAEPLYKEAVEMFLTMNGNDNPSYLKNSYQLARVYAKMGKWESALEAYMVAKSITRISKEHMLWFVELL